MKPLRAFDLMDAEPLDRRGHRLPSTLDAIASRNALLIEASGFFSGSDREIARQLRHRLMTYSQGRWRRSRADPANPHAPDTIAAMLWAILKVADRVPSVRSIRRTLADAIHGPRIGV
jgi:hypothetical protein